VLYVFSSFITLKQHNLYFEIVKTKCMLSVIISVENNIPGRFGWRVSFGSGPVGCRWVFPGTRGSCSTCFDLSYHTHNGGNDMNCLKNYVKLHTGSRFSLEPICLPFGECWRRRNTRPALWAQTPIARVVIRLAINSARRSSIFSVVARQYFATVWKLWGGP